MWVWRSPRTASVSTRSGRAPSRAASISPRSSRSSGGMRGRSSASYIDSSSVPATRSPARWSASGSSTSATSNTPYSFIFRSRSMATLRRATLWALLPVKYWSADPNSSGATTRRSTRTPSRRMLALPLPASMTSSASSQSAKSSTTVWGSSLPTSTSTSPMVSFQRRSDPASSMRSTASWRRNAPTTRSPRGRASPSRSRWLAWRASGMPSRMFCSVFAPKPLTAWISPALAALSRSSRVLMPSSS